MKKSNLFSDAVAVSPAKYALALILMILLVSCSPHPPLDLRNSTDLCESIYHFAGTGPVTAYGDVTIMSNGETHNGSIEIQQNRAGLIKADFYGPLGIVVASLQADSSRGNIFFDGRRYSFDLNQTMDTLPVQWGRGLAFKEFLRVILGAVPLAGAMEPLCKKQPDSLVKKRNAISALWKTDSMKIRLEISRKTGRPSEIIFFFEKRKPSWFLKMGSLTSGIAHKIEFRENDGNYFLIKYLKITLK